MIEYLPFEHMEEIQYPGCYMSVFVNKDSSSHKFYTGKTFAYLFWPSGDSLCIICFSNILVMHASWLLSQRNPLSHSNITKIEGPADSLLFFSKPFKCLLSTVVEPHSYSVIENWSLTLNSRNVGRLKKIWIYTFHEDHLIHFPYLPLL